MRGLRASFVKENDRSGRSLRFALHPVAIEPTTRHMKVALNLMP
jgi:hypothetical protein